MKTIIATLLLIISTNCLAQDVNKEIESDFNEYFRLISDKNIEQALDYSNPKLFTIISREQMKSLMEAAYKMPNIEYKTGLPSYLKFESVKKIDSVNYVKFYSNSPFEMKFTDIEMTQEKIIQMTQSFEAKFGNGKVTYDDKTGFFKINAEKVIIANSNDKLKEWTFVTIDNPKMKVLLQKIIPSELLD